MRFAVAGLVACLLLAACGEDPPVVVRLQVDGMHCEGCPVRIRSDLEKVEGVVEATVDPETGIATVTVSPDVPVETLIEAAERGGYEARLAEEPVSST